MICLRPDYADGRLLVVTVSLLWVSTLAQMDTSFCTSVGNPSGPSLPVLGGSFEARLEWKLGGGAGWLYLEEFLDSDTNMAAVRVTGYPQPASSALFISDYTRQRYLTVQGEACLETDLQHSDLFALPFNSASGSDHVLSAASVLELGRRSGFRYLGPTAVRNMSALAWDSCYYSNTTSQTFHVTVYFSDTPWVPPSGEERVPLRSVIRTRRHLATGQVQDALQQLDFLYFRRNLTDTSVFQAASGLYCRGRRKTRNPPRAPDHFSFRAEVLLPQSKTLGAFDEWYDFDAKVVRVDSKPLADIGVAAMAPRRQIHDFNAGVSYLLELDSGQCHVVPLSVDSLDTKFLDPNHVAIRSPQEFFRFDSGAFVYSGKKVERGVTMDTWIGTRPSFPSGLNTSSVWEWYFSTDDWLVTQFGPTVRQVPTRLKVTVPSVKSVFIYNIFDYTTQQPDPAIFDVTHCYDAENIRHFQLRVTGDITAIASQPRQFRLGVTRALLLAMNLSPLRVQNVQTQFNETWATVQFFLLSLPRTRGDVISPKSTVTSRQAVRTLVAAVNAGKFYFDVTIPTSPSGTMMSHRVSAVTDSVTELSGRQGFPWPQTQGSAGVQSGWKIGAVAGLGVGMAVAGAILGVLVTFLVLNTCSRQQKFERFQFDNLRY